MYFILQIIIVHGQVVFDKSPEEDRIVPYIFSPPPSFDNANEIPG